MAKKMYNDNYLGIKDFLKINYKLFRSIMKKFKKIYIEITNICNMSCSFCPKTNRKKEFMTLNTFREILEKIKGHTDYIYLHVKGEPFLHSQLIDFIELAEIFGINVNLTSNGTLLNEKILDLKALRQINISLHSFEENDLTKKEKYLATILRFSKLAQAKNKIISLRLWNILNPNDFSKNNDFLSKISDFFQVEIEIDSFKRGKGIKLSNNVYLNFEEVFEWPSLSNKYYGDKGFCHGLNTHLAILVDGTVVPCCLDDEGIINLGNILDVENLDFIVNGERSQNIINNFKERQCSETLCKHCQFKERF